MLFDRLCLMSEFWEMHDITKLLRMSKLFLLNGEDADSLFQKYVDSGTEKQKEIMLNGCFLPFDQCAFEISNDREGNLVIMENVSEGNYIGHAFIPAEGIYQLCKYEIFIDIEKNDLLVKHLWSKLVSLDSCRAAKPIGEKEEQYLANIFRDLVITVSVINGSGFFVVEKQIINAKPMKHKTKGKNTVRRSHERPTYLFLKPDYAQKFFYEDKCDTRSSPIPHARRAHLRRRYGKVERVRATWVGPEKKHEGNKVYKILLDK